MKKRLGTSDSIDPIVAMTVHSTKIVSALEAHGGEFNAQCTRLMDSARMRILESDSFERSKSVLSTGSNLKSSSIPFHRITPHMVYMTWLIVIMRYEGIVFRPQLRCRVDQRKRICACERGEENRHVDREVR